MAASIVLPTVGVQVGRVEALFMTAGQSGYFSAKNGRRFLALEPEGSHQELPMVVQLNYSARLAK